MEKIDEIYFKYEFVKKRVLDEYGFEGLSDEQIKESLEKLLKKYNDYWEPRMQLLIIRCYYEEFFRLKVYDAVIELCEKNILAGGRTDSLALKLIPNKKTTNDRNKYTLKFVLDSLFLSLEKIGEEYIIINRLNGHKIAVDSPLCDICDDDMFRAPSKVKGEGVSKFHRGFDFNYDCDKWKAKANEMHLVIEEYDQSFAMEILGLSEEEFLKDKDKNIAGYKVKFNDYIKLLRLASDFFSKYEKYSKLEKDNLPTKTI